MSVSIMGSLAGDDHHQRPDIAHPVEHDQRQARAMGVSLAPFPP